MATFHVISCSMDFQGGEPAGLRRLWRELQLAGAQLANDRAAVDRTMNEVCMATTVPTELRRVEEWIDQITARVGSAIAELNKPVPGPAPATVSGFPNGVEGHCGPMEKAIGSNVDELTRRFHQLREDVWNLRALKPKGPKSFDGHVKQTNWTRRNVEKQLKTWDDNGTCIDSLTVEIAREYVTLDIATELGWTATGVASAIAASEQPDSWWQVNLDIDLEPLGKVAAVAAVAAGAMAAAARDVSTGRIAFG